MLSRNSPGVAALRRVLQPEKADVVADAPFGPGTTPRQTCQSQRTMHTTRIPIYGFDPLSCFRLDRMAGRHKVTCMAQVNPATVDASVVRLLSRQEAEREDCVFWHSKTPAERLAAAEQLRQVAYGYNASTARIQAVVVRTFLKGS